MGLFEDLLELERAGWQALAEGRGDAFYDEAMTEYGVMVVPVGILDKQQAVASLREVTPWESFEIADPRVIEVGSDVAVLVYTASAKRPDSATGYTALMTSTYVRRANGWSLALHQQTVSA